MELRRPCHFRFHRRLLNGHLLKKIAGTLNGWMLTPALLDRRMVRQDWDVARDRLFCSRSGNYWAVLAVTTFVVAFCKASGGRSWSASSTRQCAESDLSNEPKSRKRSASFTSRN